MSKLNIWDIQKALNRLLLCVIRPSTPLIDTMDVFLFISAGDTPDPYVKLHISTAPNGSRQTSVKNNTKEPIWNEVFRFYLDPLVQNHLGKLSC